MADKKVWIQSATVAIDEETDALRVAALGLKVLAAGVKVVGDTSGGNAVQLTASSSASQMVILMAPTPGNANGANDDAIFASVNGSAPTHAACLLQGRYISKANFEGIRIYTDDPARVYLAGFVAGDEIRYQIIG